MKFRAGLLTLFLCFASVHVQATEKKRVLFGVLGESMTAGFFSATRIPNLQSDLVSETSVADPNPGTGPNPRQAIQANDLVMALQNWFFGVVGLESRYGYSWASGSDIVSHAVLLKQYLEKQAVEQELAVVNEAVSGAPTYRMEAQAHHLLNELKRGKYSYLEYVAVQFGANDICGNTDLSQIPDEIYRGLSVLASLKQRQPIHVLIASIPRISDLGAPEFDEQKTVFGWSCRKIHDDVLSECPLQTVWNTEAEHVEKTAVVDEVNSILRKTVDRAVLDFPGLQIVFGKSLMDYRFKLDELGADCFHPNREGQEQISRLLWADQSWYR